MKFEYNIIFHLNLDRPFKTNLCIVEAIRYIFDYPDFYSSCC